MNTVCDKKKAPDIKNAPLFPTSVSALYKHIQKRFFILICQYLYLICWEQEKIENF